jgi:hypothetical protein
MRTVMHEEHQADYMKGYEAKAQEIRDMGWQAARDKFNLDYPIGRGKSPKTLGAYYYASGEIDALVDN